MRVNRRQMLVGAATAGAGLLLARWLRRGEETLAVYDGRSPAGRRFAASARARGVEAIDVAGAGEEFWHRARVGFGLGEGAQVIGVTGWDERVYLASALRDRRLRIRHETRLDHRMFEWRIA
jgi:hypothetical protein